VQKQTKFTYQLFSLITGNKTNMLLIILGSLIAQLVLVCYGCDLGTSNITDFNATKVLD
jgi:hypothetical protein